jgi:hypothetical protein
MSLPRVDLTICTNVIPLDKKNIELNWELTTQLNTAEGWRWIVTVDNHETEDRQVESITRLGDERCELVEVYGEDIQQASLWGANYHHGAALNRILSRIKSRFVLFLDPDFYIVHPEWMPEILTHMKEHNLTFFGVPWHPKWYMKYRYFPCIHCLFIDLEKVSLESLNLMPDVPQQIAKMTGKTTPWREMKAKIRPYVPAFVRDSLQLMRWIVLNRKTIGKEWDTGSRIYLRYHKAADLNSEYVTPVFRPSDDFIGPMGAFFLFNQVIESVLPDHFCYVPKKRDYFTPRGFRETGYPDVSRMAWEEFMWQNTPFGFHVRRYPKRQGNLEDHDGCLPAALEQFIRSAQHDEQRTTN